MSNRTHFIDERTKEVQDAAQLAWIEAITDDCLRHLQSNMDNTIAVYDSDEEGDTAYVGYYRMRDLHMTENGLRTFALVHACDMEALADRDKVILFTADDVWNIGPFFDSIHLGGATR